MGSETLREAVGDERTIALIKNSARNRRYELLLGAGASFGARNVAGPLPLGKGLIGMLVDEYSDRAPMQKTDSLLRCYQRAVTAVGEAEVYAFLRRLFNDAEHQPWYADAVRFPWRRVWTLNIDDAFERAYESARSASHPRLASTSWVDPYIDDTASLQVIHLHGKVDTELPQPIVFSFADYDKKAADKVVWDQVLRSIFSSSPFVVVGTEIFGDPDMESILLNRSRQASTPSFVVNPNIDEGNEWELRQSGLIVIRSTAQEFFEQWAELCEFPDNRAELFVDASLRLPQLQARTAVQGGTTESNHDIFAGDEPRWSDAVSGRLAGFGWMNDITEAIDAWLGLPDARLLKVIGNRFSGASSGLHHATYGAVMKGVRSFWFDRSFRFNASDLAIHAQNNGPLLVVVESAADYADDLDEALRICADLGDVGLLFVAGENRRNVLRLDGRIKGIYPVDTVEVPPKLRRPDARSLSRKLFDNARAGEYEADSSVDRMVADIVGVDVFSAMLNVSGGSGFLARMQQELATLHTWQKKLVLLLQVASADQLSLSYTEASLALGINSDVIADEVVASSSLSALVESADGQLHARQRDRALGSTIAAIGEQKALNWLVELVADLHPLVQQDSLRARNRAALLVGHIMSVKFLMEQFPNGDLEVFYERLQPKYGQWNGRYWEQRALLYKRRSEWSRAESYAARAVTLFDGAFTRTTYGTILINRAAHYMLMNDARWLKTYTRGKQELEYAQARSEEKFVSRFAYLTAVIELIERGVESGRAAQSDQLASVADDWSMAYSHLRITIANSQDVAEAESRAEGLSRRFQRIRLPENLSSDLQSDGFAEGHDFEAIVKRKVPGGLLVDCPGIGVAIVQYRLQQKSPNGVPNRVPDLEQGKRIRIRILNAQAATPKGIFVRTG